jgi:AcrR family transcriptional regulator
MAPARTRTTDALSAAGDAELGSAAQRERRKRILDATLALASKGGYDAVQMRTVAERADVALGTLYRYFPSKIHLLVSALTWSSSGRRRSSTAGPSRATRRTSA